MWKSSSSIVGKTSGMDDLKLDLQQEINDFLHISQVRKNQKQLPRINRVDFTKATIDSMYCVCMHMQVCTKEYQEGWPLTSIPTISSLSSLAMDRGKFTLVLRIPRNYPAQSPDIACVTGGESVPSQFKRGNQFVLPWLEFTWPSTYTLMDLAQDLCVSLEHPEKIHSKMVHAEQKVFPLNHLDVPNSPSSYIPPVLPSAPTTTSSMQNNNNNNNHSNMPSENTSMYALFASSAMNFIKPSIFIPSSQQNPTQSAPSSPKKINEDDCSHHIYINTGSNPSSNSSATTTITTAMNPPDLLDSNIVPTYPISPSGCSVTSPLHNNTTIGHSSSHNSNHNSGHNNLSAIGHTGSHNKIGSLRQGDGSFRNIQQPQLQQPQHVVECSFIKCKYKDETRRFPIDANLSFISIEELIKRLFQISANVLLLIAYMDVDGDKCILSSDEELRAAISHVSNSNTLCIFVETKGIELIPDVVTSPQASKVNEETNLREIRIEDVKLEKCIGTGSSCKVYKALWRGTEVAIKKFTLPDMEAVNKEFKHEIQMMSHLGCHPCIVLLLAYCNTPKSIIFEYLPFSLFEQINGSQDASKKIPPFPNTWSKRLQMSMDVARGLQFLHSFNIIHRDLKSLNLLITDEGRVKLADFGIAKVAQVNEYMTRCCGTYQWMAPEVIVSQTYSVSADIYSFGIVMWEICEASAPFAEIPAALVAMAVIQENKRPTLSATIPGPLRDLICQCWSKDPALRPDAGTIVQKLTQFFQASQK